ncbi:hypothetical protein ADUPG1_009488 [Aduncisulcus paluster]|uniref:Uncharacterized protein n=1 Tax=Aduncisulcus paluster TaxID=2918883 RepID=A0ABQ5KVR2_9EUKA|nr:hypothetical protein ADUPG1_009488 [Aduncisulcus paluster]|eukprot:gnl/Carplike_NY0171/3302_a4445_641.p1 GENE.gnl/Carplike_NY0171/3302_a4445_641~~gnl/Carplike_NY0171/3302_a4445_641.p1  ORF type:complete len:226 (+),score=41.37 gnl/Carplike_NY0171/3302_a4445_641:28-705(+)
MINISASIKSSPIFPLELGVISEESTLSPSSPQSPSQFISSVCSDTSDYIQTFEQVDEPLCSSSLSFSFPASSQVLSTLISSPFLKSSDVSPSKLANHLSSSIFCQTYDYVLHQLAQDELAMSIRQTKQLKILEESKRPIPSCDLELLVTWYLHYFAFSSDLSTIAKYMHLSHKDMEKRLLTWRKNGLPKFIHQYAMAYGRSVGIPHSKIISLCKGTKNMESKGM